MKKGKKLLSISLAALMALTVSGCAKNASNNAKTDKVAMQYYDENENSLLCLIMVDESGYPKTEELYGYVNVSEENGKLKYDFKNYFTGKVITLTDEKYKGAKIYYKPVEDFNLGIHREKIKKDNDFFKVYTDTYAPVKIKNGYVLYDTDYDTEASIINDTDIISSVAAGRIIPDFYEFNTENYYKDNNIEVGKVIVKK